MAEKILNTRVILKHDTLANWNNEAALILKEGEVALAKVEQNKVDPISGQLVKVPTYLIKVGDGTSKFSALNWVAAPAADVHDWAKKSETEFTTWVKGLIDVTDIDAYSKGEADEKFVAKEADKSLVADTEIERLSNMSDGANKVESSSTNGNIKIDGVETAVYTHPEKHAIDDVDGLRDALDNKVNYVIAGDKSINVDADEGDANGRLITVNLDPASDNALKLNENGLKVEIPEVKVPEYTITKAENSGEYAAVYNLIKDGTIVGASINIPKDIVVKSGSVIGDKIVLVLNDEAATQIEIPVASLIEYVTSGSQTGDMVVVHVDETTHKVTATITDGTITLDKLEQSIRLSLESADTAIQQSDIDLLQLDTMSKEKAEDYIKKTEAAGYNDILTKTEATTTYQPKGDYATADQGGKADTAVQDVTAAADSGLKATRTNNDIAIEIDDTITWVFDCGGSGVTA